MMESNIKKKLETQAEVERVDKLMGVLAEDADNYLRMIELETFSNADKSVIVPKDSRIWLPMSSMRHFEEEDEDF